MYVLIYINIINKPILWLVDIHIRFQNNIKNVFGNIMFVCSYKIMLKHFKNPTKRERDLDR